MARRVALLSLEHTLQARSADLRKGLAGELANLRDFKSADSTSDSADVAFEDCSDQMSSQLAELGTLELRQLERALVSSKDGRYGICENCQKKIPLTRLNALPSTTFCIKCEQEMEMHPNGHHRRDVVNWARVSDSQAPMQDQQINLAQLEMGLSGRR